ncbi:mitochondrial inner membrane [Aspergillus sclerotialis]|uniref:Mitochondrial inner membrane n=1 Tax=Aspergillus sclerotialis TaxID=2070753 RepID=A0A3A2ZBN0_9EURO|nr:mitochondrial inner membrane [Aspergillus sclerotialis]
MFRQPIPRAFLRNFRASSSSPQLLVPRIASPFLRPSAFQTISPVGFSSQIHTPSRAALSSLPRTITFSLRRPFSSSPLRAFRTPPGRYRRFDQGQWSGQQPSIPHIVVLLVGGAGVFYIYNLETVEATGRRRFNCIPHSKELQLGDSQYKEILRSASGHILPESHPLTQSVNRVLQRLIPEAPIEGANWRVHVINDPSTTNAFVIPGGKVFVFTGILGICGDEDGLAAVLSHEIAHVVAHHQGERISHNLLTTGAILLATILFDVSQAFTRVLFDVGFGLPNSRVQEAEADEMGLMMMAKACFDPNAAVKFWARMQKAEKVKIPQFMSTHPTHYNRMEAIRERLSKAEALYEEKGCHFIKNNTLLYSEPIPKDFGYSFQST